MLKTMKKLFAQCIVMLLFTSAVLHAGNYRWAAGKTDFSTTNMVGKVTATTESVIMQSVVSNVEISSSHSASITFRNKSDYTMTLKIIYSSGGLYSTVVLSPHSGKVVNFSKSNTFKLKIKAELYGDVSYHDGGYFSVKCTEYEWTEGEMSFELSSYGSGLGPKISAKEFESNY